MHVLVVAGDDTDRDRLAAAITRLGHTVATAEGAAAALARIAAAGVDAIFCDATLPDGDAIGLIAQARARGHAGGVIVLTDTSTGAAAREACRAGAWDCIARPVRDEELAHRLAQLEAMRALERELRSLRSLVMGGAQPVYQFMSPAMQAVDRVVARIGAGEGAVLIQGESGTGKGVTARRIHELSPRRDGPFVAIKCAALTEPHIELELFGLTQGTYARADRPRRGLLTQADGGTLFLEDIDRLPLRLQSRLLQWFEDRDAPASAAEPQRRADVRLVAATHRELQIMVLHGRFCAGLLERLSLNRITVPPLRERRVDIPALVQHLLMQRVAPPRSGESLAIDREAMELLVDYHWPGNVRQLVEVLHRAAILADAGCIRAGNLPREISRAPAGVEADEMTLRERVRRFEVSLILRAIEHCGGDRRAAAAKLGIGLSSLYRKLEELQGEVPAGG